MKKRRVFQHILVGTYVYSEGSSVRSSFIMDAPTKTVADNGNKDCPTTDLSLDAIHQAMDAACAVTLNRKLANSSSTVLERAKDKNLDTIISSIGQCHSLVLKCTSSPETIKGKISFYIAYSSWTGPELYMTDMHLEESHKEHMSSILYTVAEIAVSLDCSRLVWQTFESNEEDRKLFDELGAETMKGVLTLRLKRTKMIDFLATRTIQQSEVDMLVFSPVALIAKNIDEAVDACLIPSNAILEPKQLRLRRAKRNDVDSILGLVQGLADYVKESDAVKITTTRYLVDGFGDAPPLFHCILVEDTAGESAIPVGTAFFFFGHSSKYGRFLYLEDLFVQEQCRGRGGGKQLMYTLTSVCQNLDCESFVWQALDWNTPSLAFYKNIGAEIQNGVITLRFAGDKLHDFIKTRSVNSS